MNKFRQFWQVLLLSFEKFAICRYAVMNGKEFLIAAFLPKKLIFIDGAAVDASRASIKKVTLGVEMMKT